MESNRYQHEVEAEGEIERLRGEVEELRSEIRHINARETSAWNAVLQRDTEIERLKAEVEAADKARHHAMNANAVLLADLNAERQRARLPVELVERLRAVQAQVPDIMTPIERDILAWHERETRDE